MQLKLICFIHGCRFMPGKALSFAHVPFVYYYYVVFGILRSCNNPILAGFNIHKAKQSNELGAGFLTIAKSVSCEYKRFKLYDYI